MDSLIKSVEARLKQWTRSLSRDESRKIAWALSRIPRDSLVMEVGCGFGGKLEMLRKLGFRQVMGVEKNPESAAQAASRGFTVLTVAEYDQQPPPAVDLLVLSHIIEHVPPHDLVAMMDHYLEAVKPGGHVLIVSPVLHRHFYLDLDHIKPYYPQSIKVFFGKNDEQIPYYSRSRIKLKDVYFCKKSFRIKLSRALLLKQRRAVFLHLINFLSALLFRATFRLAGQTNAWVGLFQKAGR